MSRKLICWTKGLLALFMVLSALAFMGCQNQVEPEFIDRQFIPAGMWTGFSDFYEILGSTVLYHTDAYVDTDGEDPDYSSPATNLKGDIIIAVDFSETSGVLIIKVTDSGGSSFTTNKFTGIYYSEYSTSSIKMANPWSGAEPVQKDTLNDALKTFTADNVGDHVSMWGSYTK
jgi:hypothetical protein